ncbi:hypothetical protein G7Y89_g1438 [Cudoniella acicularis]|uniref:Uncharacterized protein n=1 Tax=Cudoniella acicularis TaxID=354080 RepID=A0A8H4RX30_9HELO|nr:hypothetical protein G7Y89_g1438 [Cudoniella acicularis]
MTVAAALVCLSHIAEAKTFTNSEVFGWQYELDPMAPIITQKHEILAIARAHNKTVGIEMVNGTMMIIDHLQRKQVATMQGDVEQWARSSYPHATINDSALIEKTKAVAIGHLDNIRSGIPLHVSMAMTTGESEAGNNLDRRGCVACFLSPASCLIQSCDKLCIIASCFTTSVNIITWNRAYSMFPAQTVIHHKSYALRLWNDEFGSLLREQVDQGWTNRDIIWPDLTTDARYRIRNGLRRVGDRSSLAVPLDTTDVQQASTPDSAIEFAQFKVFTEPDTPPLFGQARSERHGSPQI